MLQNDFSSKKNVANKITSGLTRIYILIVGFGMSNEIGRSGFYRSIKIVNYFFIIIQHEYNTIEILKRTSVTVRRRYYNIIIFSDQEHKGTKFGTVSKYSYYITYYNHLTAVHYADS